MNTSPYFSIYDSYKKRYVYVSITNTPIDNVDAEFVKTRTQGQVALYHCGLTAYSYAHVGNVYAALFTDFVVKSLQFCGFSVIHIENITDVGHLVADGDDGVNIADGEDKLELSAKLYQKTPRQITDEFYHDYVTQCEALHITLPHGKFAPRATDYIPEQLEIALQLLQKGRAYVIDGDAIYFDYEKNLDLHLPFDTRYFGDSAFTNRDIVSQSKHPKDFALWKFVSHEHIQKWKIQDFPELVSLIPQEILSKYPHIITAWGAPGWHTECVSMIAAIMSEFSRSDGLFVPYISQQIQPFVDMHLGGIEHMPVHHQNEMWQSEALQFHLASVWVHNQHIVIDGQKMSKSLGNGLYILGLDKPMTSIEKEGFIPISFRLFALEQQYQHTLNFTFDKLQQSQNRLYNMRRTAAHIYTLCPTPDAQDENDEYVRYKQQFIDLVSHNMRLFDVVTLLHSELDRLLSNVQASSQNIDEIKMQLYVLFQIDDELLQLGVFPPIQSEAYQEACALRKLRHEAKQEKQYSRADEMRDRIMRLGFGIDDYAGGLSGIWYTK